MQSDPLLTGNQGQPLDVIELYDVEKDEWTTASKSMSLAHCSCTYITHKGKLYVIGGLSTQGPTNAAECITFAEEGEEPKRSQGRNNKKNK